MTPQQRRNYVLYHDCVAFDSTFGTNCFRMPLVLVAGVDGEGHTILLATALLSEERSNSYEWFLEQLAEAGYWLPTPTDGDLVFPDAIASVFPSTRHFLCAYHLSQNLIQAAAGSLGDQCVPLVRAFSRPRKIEDVAKFEREWQSVLSAMEYAPVADHLAGFDLLISCSNSLHWCENHTSLSPFTGEPAACDSRLFHDFLKAVSLD
jgi:transposase-like protein